MPDINVSGLARSFGSTAAVAGISFTVPDGSFTTLLGPSGCGKTTTLRMLAGLERPDGGEIRIGDRLVAAPEKGVFVPVEARHVGIVFQSYALWPHMNVFDHVAYPLRVRRVKSDEIKRRVIKALELVDLADQRRRYPSEISGGQQQRVALARALVFDPTVLFLDEPLSNLDAALRTTMRLELSRLHKETGVTTVYVTHDQSEALVLSDQILVMRFGEIMEQGTPVEVYESPQTIYGARFVGAANCLSARLTKIDGPEAVVELATGDLLQAPADRLGESDVGAPVTVVLRPEDVHVDVNRASSNVLSGIVRQASYFGSHRELVVAVGPDQIKVQAPKSNTSGVEQALLLHVPPDRLRILPRTRPEPQPETVPAELRSAAT
jgi:iron(III) transport system ATP-binding protein